MQGGGPPSDGPHPSSIPHSSQTNSGTTRNVARPSAHRIVSGLLATSAGTYVSQIYRAGVKDHVVGLAPFGPSVTPDIQQLATTTEQSISDGKLFPFQGPVRDQSGTVRIEAGKRPTTTELETTDYLVEGVTGNIPK